MKPAPFELLVPETLDDALALLSDHAPDARVLAGGQSLVPMMNFRLARPAVLIDLNRIAGLAYFRETGAGLAIGAMSRTRAIERSEAVRAHAPLLNRATQHVAHLPVRTRGTIGGSLANADPAAEYPAAILALDATLVARSVRGERRIAAADFFAGVMTTALEGDEILTEIVVPPFPVGTGAAFAEIARRRGDYALAGVAAQITLEGGRVADVRLAACGVGPGPVRLRDAEAAVRDAGPTADAFVAAGRAAAAEVDPDGDVHASADYRRRLAAVMTKRALDEAAARAREAA